MRSKISWGLAAVVVLAGAGVLVAHLSRPRIHVGAPGAARRVPLDQIDHAAFERLLHQYVDEQGLVAYARWKAVDQDRQALADYLAYLGTADLSQPADRSARLAFWINVYNALTLQGMLREYPTRSIKDHVTPVGGYSIWRDLLLWIDGQAYSLDNIEHDILRKLDEPRIHFALVCASRGCPPLPRRAFTAADLDRQLADNARRFFARPENFRADPASRTVFVSELLHWYGTDFAPTPEDQVRSLRPYFPNADRLDWLDAPHLTVEYLPYDWSLNDQQPPAR